MTEDGARGLAHITNDHAKEVVVVVRRPVDVTLRLRVDPAVYAATGGPIDCVASASMQTLPLVSLLDRTKEDQIATFGLAHSAEQTTKVRVDCAEHNTLTWYCGANGAQRSQVQREAVPAGVDAFESECLLGVGLMLLVTVVDGSDRPLPHVHFVAWSDSGARRYECATDENGKCIRFVPPGDHGKLELPWRYAPWVEGGEQWQQDPDCPGWAAGSLVRVIADMNKVLRVRFQDWQGAPVPAFRWSDHNNGSRTHDGKAQAGFGEAADGVACLYSKGTLPAGSVLFVRADGAGESYAVVPRDLVAGQGVHTLRLARVTLQTLLIRVAASFPGKAGGTVSLRLESAAEDVVPKRYFIQFPRTAAAQEFVVSDVLPGTYMLKEIGGVPSATRGPFALEPDREWSILLE